MRGWFTRKKSPQVVFHIGLPKCGSTTIQAHFADYDAAYRLQGVVYPKAGRSPDGYRSHVPLLHATAETLSEQVQAIAEEAGDARIILLSSEAFADYLPRGNAEDVGAALVDVFGAENVSVLAYFRTPVPFLASSYAQFVVGGLFDVPKGPYFAHHVPGVTSFVRATAERKGFAPYDYLGWAGAMRAAFPKCHLNLRSMERADLRGDLITDLCRVLKVRRQGHETVVLNRRRAAPSILALQHAQTVFLQPVFQKQRTKMRQFTLSSTAQWSEADCLHQDLMPAPELVGEIARCMQEQEHDLRRLFSNRVAGLCDVQAAEALSDRNLTAAECKEVEAAFNLS